MPRLDILLDGDNAFADVDPATIQHLRESAKGIRVVAVAGGMASGKTSVAIGFDLGDRYVIFETSLSLLGVAVDAIRTKYPHG